MGRERVSGEKEFSSDGMWDAGAGETGSEDAGSHPCFAGLEYAGWARSQPLCQWIRSNWEELPVIFLTVRGDSCDIVSGFRNGADDYVVKPFALEVLYSRIQAVLRRTGNVAKRYLSCGRIVIDVERRKIFCYEGEKEKVIGERGEISGEGKEVRREIMLSAAEYQLLLYLMRNKRKTVTM